MDIDKDINQDETHMCMERELGDDLNENEKNQEINDGEFYCD